MKRILLIICFLLIPNIVFAASEKTDDNWDIFMYVCGSNLEDQYHYWTKNIQEIQSVGVKPGINFVQRYGGSNDTEQQLLKEMMKRKSMTLLKPDNKWYYMEPSYQYTDMSQKETLSEFLKQIAPYKSKHKVLIMWDHGGGSLGGIFLDSNSKKTLSINDMGAAFKENFTPNPNNPPFDIIIFNACLMNTVEVAKSLEGMTRYIVASEDVMPGSGLDYAAFTRAMNDNPDITPLELSKLICDSYMEKCKNNRTSRCITMSVIDMKKLPKLDKAYTDFGQSIEKKLGNDEKLLTKFAEKAFWAEDYGGNTVETGFFNMVDTYGLAEASKSLVPGEAKKLQKAITETVAYNVHGPYRKYSYGISTFFPFSGEEKHINAYAQLTNSNKNLNNVYKNMLNQPFNLLNLFDIPLTPVGKDALQLIMPADEYYKTVNFCAILLKKDTDGTTYYMGCDDRIQCDEKKYKIDYSLPKTWFALNGHTICTTIIDAQQDYNVMSAPLSIGGVRYNLIFAYDLKTQNCDILGLVRKKKQAMIAFPYMSQPKDGAKITIMNVQASRKYGKLEFKSEPGESFILKGDLTVTNEPLPPGNYEISLRFDNILGISALSQPYPFTIK